MFVCLCNGVTERDIVRAVDAGVTSFGELQASTDVAAGCGSCADCARQLLHTALRGCSRQDSETNLFGGRNERRQEGYRSSEQGAG